MVKADKKKAKGEAKREARRRDNRTVDPALAKKPVRITLRTLANAGDKKVVVLPRSGELKELLATAKKKFTSKKNKLKKPTRAFLVDEASKFDPVELIDATKGGGGTAVLLDGDMVAVSDGDAPEGLQAEEGKAEEEEEEGKGEHEDDAEEQGQGETRERERERERETRETTRERRPERDQGETRERPEREQGERIFLCLCCVCVCVCVYGVVLCRVAMRVTEAREQEGERG